MASTLSRSLSRGLPCSTPTRLLPRFASTIPSPPAPPSSASRPPQKRPQKAKKGKSSAPASILAHPSPTLPSKPSIASLLLPVGFTRSRFNLSSLGATRDPPTGQAIALTTAESYDTPSLLSGLHALGLLEGSGSASAVNLLGEAIYLPRWRVDTTGAYGEVFIFESGTIVTWGLEARATEAFLSNVIRGSSEGQEALGWVERGRYKEPEMEVLDYWVQKDGETAMKGDAIHLTAPPSSASTSLSSSPPSQDLLARLAFSSGMARVTKLGVYEGQFDEFAEGTAGIPQLLETGDESPVKKQDIIKRVGTLHGFRQKLNLEDGSLLDEPEFLWEDAALHEFHTSICKALEFDTRLQTLNQRVDYAFQLQSTLMELLNTKTSHRLEWIIIFLIAFEIGIVLIREGAALLHDDEGEKKKTDAATLAPVAP